MCGLFGVNFNKPDSRIVPLVAALAVTMDCRGGDSYGFWADGELHKGMGTFTSSNQARNFGGVTKLMAHTRLASVGAKTEENAHPFHIGNIVGAHNGHIGNWWDLNKEYERKFDVDSMQIFAHINDYGFDRLSELNGYGAITWLDDRDPECFNLARWNSGDLAICDVTTKDGTELGTVWASTLKALAPALEVAGFKFKIYKVDEKKLYYTRGQHLFVDKRDLAFGSKSWTNRSYIGLPGKKKSETQAPKTSSSGLEKPIGYWQGGGFHQFEEIVPTKFSKDKEKTLYVKKLSEESKQKLRLGGFEIEYIGNNDMYRLTRKEPLRRGTEGLDFPKETTTQRRKCFGCDTPNINTCRHEEIGAPLCYYCYVTLDTALETDTNEVDEFTKMFDEKIKQEEEVIPPAFKDFLESGIAKDDKVEVPDTFYGYE